MRTRILAAVSVALAGTFTIAGTAPAIPVSADSADLFFSEYIEGSSNNKAIEIFNATGLPVDLAAGDYTIEQYSNGSSSGTAGPNNTLDLEGVIANGDVYVVANSSAVPAILDVADVTSSVTFFNGDDGLVLKKAGVVIDSFGQYGVDPGTQWAGGGLDDTLIRKPAVCAGDSNFNDVFDASVDWDVFPVDTFTDLGVHTSTCIPAELVVEVNPATQTVASENPATITAEVAGGSEPYQYQWYEGPVPGTPIGGEVLSTLTVTTGDVGMTAYYVEVTDDDATVVTSETATVNVEVATAVVLDPFVPDAYTVGLNESLELTVTVDSGTGPFAYEWFEGTAPTGTSTGGTEATFNTGPLTESTSYYVVVTGAAGATTSDPITITVTTPCLSTATPIHMIQGDGAASSLDGAIVIVEGIVVGDFQDGVAGTDGDFNGFHLQEQDDETDGDPDTSEGLFVFDSATLVNVAPGDRVAAEGTVDEFNGLTELVNVTAIEVCDLAAEHDDVLTPATPTLPIPVEYTKNEYLETFEGMAVEFPGALTIAEYFNFDQFGEIGLSSERLYTPTAVADPGPAAAAVAEYNSRRFLLMDDGYSVSNRFPPRHPDGSVYSPTNSFRGGDTLTGLVGVMDFSFSNYKIQPTDSAVHAVVNVRPLTPPAVGGDLTVIGLNVLNYFSTLDGTTEGSTDGPNVCGPAGNLDCRGANDETERVRQLDKIVNTLIAVDPAVAGLIELGNPLSSVPAADDPELNEIVDALNADPDDASYAFIETGAVGTDAIRQGIVYQPALVTPVGAVQILSTQAFVNPFNGSVDRNRPTVAQTFEEVATGEQFVVSVNHLKSKGSGCSEPGGGNDPLQGNCNGVRTASAQVLADWLADESLFPDQDILILGDLNSYDHEDPIGVLEDAGYVDLEKLYGGEFAYSYVFNGQIGYLDYGMATTSLTAQVTGAGAWHTNSDEPDILSFDKTFTDASLYADDPFRASDHDPVLVGLALSPIVTINQAAGQVDPTNVGSVEFTVEFSVPVTGFTASDVVVTGTATTGAPVVTGTGPGTTFTVTIPVTSDGTVIVDIPAGAANGGLGAPSLASTSTDNSVTVDTTRPSVTVTPPATRGNRPGPAVYIIAFSEPVTGLLISELQITGGTIGYTPTLTTATGTTWLLTFDPDTAKAKFNAKQVTVSVPEGVAIDAAGNTNTASVEIASGGTNSLTAE